MKFTGNPSYFYLEPLIRAVLELEVQWDAGIHHLWHHPPALWLGFWKLPSLTWVQFKTMTKDLLESNLVLGEGDTQIFPMHLPT